MHLRLTGTTGKTPSEAMFTNMAHFGRFRVKNSPKIEKIIFLKQNSKIK